jgi:hypothetical protein
MKRYWLIPFLMLVVAILSCRSVATRKPVTLSLPPLPSVRVTKAEVVVSPNWTTNIEGTNVVVCGVNKFGKSVCFTNLPTFNYSPLISYGWDYKGVTNNVVFIVLASTNFVNWTRLGVVTNQWFTVAKLGAQTFYKVLASNTVSGFTSGQF